MKPRRPVRMPRRRKRPGAATARPVAPDSGPSQPTWALRGSSAAIAAVRAFVGRTGPGREPVVVGGEPGSGHLHAAGALHAAGDRPNGPFVVFDCAAGSEEGMGARLAGEAARATGGTFVLVEPAAAPGPLQDRLVLLIENAPAGGAAPRIVACTSRDLREAAAAGVFSRILLSRLEGRTVRLPALRERAEDVPELLEAVLRERGGREVTVPALQEDARRALIVGDWPGNLLDLEHLARRW
ncbi:MAG: sigma 54-interacting transcriptional regulator, partial [bacterium]